MSSDASGAAVVVSDEGVDKVEALGTTGGWAQFGFDADESGDEG